MNETMESIDNLDPARAAALHSLLGIRCVAPVEGCDLPIFWHLIYFWSATRLDELGSDGHLKRSELNSDDESVQRVWGGGSLYPKRPLKIGVPAGQCSIVEKQEEKHGRSGPLKLVTNRYEYSQHGVTSFVERRHIIYRNAKHHLVHSPTANLPASARCEFEIVFDEVGLFRYSALTYNSHRIHYDIDYCRNVAGYPQLVVHGPLLATWISRIAATTVGEIKEFSYVATSPAFCGETVRIFSERESSKVKLWACVSERLCMRAVAEW